MPKLWNKTIRKHQESVRDKALDATADLIEIEGPTAVTMPRIALATGIHRSTLYRYFDDVQDLLIGYYNRQTARHLAVLASAKDSLEVGKSLAAVIETYAIILHEDCLLAFVKPVHERLVGTDAQQSFREMVQQLIPQAALSQQVRGDIPPHELVSFAFAALSAVEALSSPSAVRRLVSAILDGLQARQK